MISQSLVNYFSTSLMSPMWLSVTSHLLIDIIFVTKSFFSVWGHQLRVVGYAKQKHIVWCVDVTHYFRKMVIKQTIIVCKRTYIQLDTWTLCVWFVFILCALAINQPQPHTYPLNKSWQWSVLSEGHFSRYLIRRHSSFSEELLCQPSGSSSIFHSTSR